MKKRTVAGGLIVGGVLLGTWLSGWFPDFGTGHKLNLGEHEGSDGDSSAQVSLTSDSHPAAVDPQRPIEPEFALETTTAPEPTDVLRIVIADRNYYLRSGAGDETRDHRIELADLVEKARQVKGDEDGVKVRVYRKASARATAELALQQELHKAGLTDEQIQQHEGLVD